MGSPVVIRRTAGNLQGGWTNVRITVATAQHTPLCVLYRRFYTLMARMREKGGERKEGDGEGVLLLALLRRRHCCVVGTKERERGRGGEGGALSQGGREGGGGRVAVSSSLEEGRVREGA